MTWPAGPSPLPRCSALRGAAYRLSRRPHRRRDADRPAPSSAATAAGSVPPAERRSCRAATSRVRRWRRSWLIPIRPGAEQQVSDLHENHRSAGSPASCSAPSKNRAGRAARRSRARAIQGLGQDRAVHRPRSRADWYELDDPTTGGSLAASGPPAGARSGRSSPPRFVASCRLSWKAGLSRLEGQSMDSYFAVVIGIGPSVLPRIVRESLRVASLPAPGVNRGARNIHRKQTWTSSEFNRPAWPLNVRPRIARPTSAKAQVLTQRRYDGMCVNRPVKSLNVRLPIPGNETRRRAFGRRWRATSRRRGAARSDHVFSPVAKSSHYFGTTKANFLKIRSSLACLGWG